MTIDEAITRAREVAEIQRNNDKLNKTLGKSSPYYNTDCIKCAEEHEQLADWLEELKSYRECNVCEYNKAIDDFANTLKENYDYLPQILSQEAFCGYIDEYAEQLKECGENEQSI